MFVSFCKVWYLEQSLRKESKYNLGKENRVHEHRGRDIKHRAQVPAAESQRSLTAVLGAKPVHGSWEWRSPLFSHNSLKMLSKGTQRVIFYWEQSLFAHQQTGEKTKTLQLLSFDVWWLGIIWPSPSGLLLAQQWKWLSPPGSQSSQTLRIWGQLNSQVQNMGSPKPCSSFFPA